MRDFVANVSHELRTPLTAVRGYVEALMEEPIEPEQRRKFLDVIDRHTGRMERLVRDLLRLARLDAQQETADVHAIDVASAVSSRSEPICPERIVKRQQLHVEIKVDRGCGRHRRRPDEDARRAAQSRGKRGELLSGRRARRARGAPRRGSRAALGGRLRPGGAGYGSRPGSSSASTAWTNPARAIRAPPASACPSCATWSSCTAAK